MSEFKTTIEKAIEKEVIRRVDEELQNADIKVFYKGIQLDIIDSFNDGEIKIDIIAPTPPYETMNAINDFLKDFSGVKK
jgi:hypothetical protein